MPGLLLSVIAATLFGLTTVLQKRSLMGMRKLSVRRVLRDRLWTLSVFVGLAGIICYITAMRYSPISVVQPMLAISIATPVLVGWLAFGERMGSRWVHVVIMIIGIILVSL